MKRPRNVIVLMGGPSPEREVSLLSAKKVCEHLSRDNNVFPIEISVDGQWILRQELDPIRAKEILKQLDGIIKTSNNKFNTSHENHILDVPSIISDSSYKITDLRFDHSTVQMGGTSDVLLDPTRIAKHSEIDVVFIAMHGQYGEDGTIQGLLDFLGIPYTGSGVTASAIGMDKIKTQSMLKGISIPVPDFMGFTISHWDKFRPLLLDRIKLDVGFPCVVKPNNSGSSIGISLVDDIDSLINAISTAFNYDNNVIVESFVKGVEISCGVLGNWDDPDDIIVLPPTEIIPLKRPFFDYESKYTPGWTKEITPARISDSLTRRVRDLARIAHMTLGCDGFSRTDMIVRDHEVFVLEINTIPGLTELSLFPQACQAVGMTFSDLLDRIIDLALAKRIPPYFMKLHNKTRHSKPSTG